MCKYLTALLISALLLIQSHGTSWADCPNGYTPACAAAGCTAKDAKYGITQPGYLSGHDGYTTLDVADNPLKQGTKRSLYYAGEYKKESDCSSHPIYKVNLINPCRLVTYETNGVPQMNLTILEVKEDTLWGEDIQLSDGTQVFSTNKVSHTIAVKGAEHGEYINIPMEAVVTAPNNDPYRGKAVKYTVNMASVYQFTNCPTDTVVTPPAPPAPPHNCAVFANQSDVYDCCDSHPGAQGCPIQCSAFTGSGFTTCCARYPNGLGCSPMSTGVRTDCGEYSDPAEHAACCTFQGNTGCN